MKNKTWDIVLGLLVILFGISFLVSPVSAFGTIVYIAGLMLIIFNVARIITAYKSNSNFLLSGMTSYIVGIVFGLILIGNRKNAVEIIPVFIGLWFLIGGLSKLLVLLKRSKDIKILYKPIIEMAVGLIVVILPIIPVVAAGLIIGIILIMSGVTIIIGREEEKTVYKVKVKK